MFTKRNIVKFAKDQIIWAAATNVITKAINTTVDEPTENQEIGIEIGATIGGYVAMRCVKAPTDNLIDSVADWRKNRKVAKNLAEVVE